MMMLYLREAQEVRNQMKEIEQNCKGEREREGKGESLPILLEFSQTEEGERESH